MLNKTTSLGQRVRALRRGQARTLQEIADACAVTRSMLSKVETGKTNPTAALLGRIAKALGVSMAGLLEQGGVDQATVFCPANSTAAMTPTEKGYRFFAFATARPDKAMQPFLFRARRGQVASKPLAHPGEEFVFLVKGELKYRVGAAQYHLRPGDSLYFGAEQEHDLEPISPEVEYLAVFCGPAAPPKRRRIAAKGKKP